MYFFLINRVPVKIAKKLESTSKSVPEKIQNHTVTDGDDYVMNETIEEVVRVRGRPKKNVEIEKIVDNNG